MPPAPDVPTLSDGSVTLRAHVAGDVEGVYEQSTDPLSQAWTTVPRDYTREHARSFALEIVPAGWRENRWAFAVEAEGAYAATVELRDEGDGRAELAFGSHPRVRGTGVMERACRLLLDWGFSARDVHTVVWRANTGNWASRKLAWRLGFSFDGTVRRYLPHHGELVDAWFGTLLATDDRTPRGVWLETPELTDGELRLRAPAPRDLPRVIEACDDERTQRWLGRMPSPYGEAEAEEWLQQVTLEAAEGSSVNWAVTDQDDVMLADVNLFDISLGVDAEVGFWAHPDARGRGVTTRAASLALRHGFERLGLLRIQGHAALGNRASRHALGACGMREAGVSRLGTFIRPEGRVDAMKYDVLVEEWRAARRAGR